MIWKKVEEENANKDGSRCCLCEERFAGEVRINKDYFLKEKVSIAAWKSRRLFQFWHLSQPSISHTVTALYIMQWHQWHTDRVKPNLRSFCDLESSSPFSSSRITLTGFFPCSSFVASSQRNSQPGLQVPTLPEPWARFPVDLEQVLPYWTHHFCGKGSGEYVGDCTVIATWPLETQRSYIKCTCRHRKSIFIRV